VERTHSTKRSRPSDLAGCIQPVDGRHPECAGHRPESRRRHTMDHDNSRPGRPLMWGGAPHELCRPLVHAGPAVASRTVTLPCCVDTEHPGPAEPARAGRLQCGTGRHPPTSPTPDRGCGGRARGRRLHPRAPLVSPLVTRDDPWRRRLPTRASGAPLSARLGASSSPHCSVSAAFWRFDSPRSERPVRSGG
jgi:hypothetical protein